MIRLLSSVWSTSGSYWRIIFLFLIGVSSLLLIGFTFLFVSIGILYLLRKILNEHLCFYLINPIFQRLSSKFGTIMYGIINYWCSATWNIVQGWSITEIRQGVFPVKNVHSFLKHFRWGKLDLLSLKLVHLFLNVWLLCSWLSITKWITFLFTYSIDISLVLM